MLNFTKILNMGGIILGCKTHNMQVHTISQQALRSLQRSIITGGFTELLSTTSHVLLAKLREV